MKGEDPIYYVVKSQEMCQYSIYQI